jgi:methylaspartate ammonia-lyase
MARKAALLTWTVSLKLVSTNYGLPKTPLERVPILGQMGKSSTTIQEMEIISMVQSVNMTLLE